MNAQPNKSSAPSKPIAKGRMFEVGDIPVEDGNGGLRTYKCAALIVFDSVDDLRNAIRYGSIEALYRIGDSPSPDSKE
jgi:hypothetical protein